MRTPHLFRKRPKRKTVATLSEGYVIRALKAGRWKVDNGFKVHFRRGEIRGWVKKPSYLEAREEMEKRHRIGWIDVWIVEV